MPRSVAINVGANTNEPGFRGPIYPDGRFVFVPIPESEPALDVPTYGDLDLGIDLPEDVSDLPVHLDPEFAEYPHCRAYTYGDPFGVKARPLLELQAGDYVFFYATLAFQDEDHPDDARPGRRRDGDRAAWVNPDWGAYVVGQFRLERDPIEGEAVADLADEVRNRLSNNAHVKRERFDARVLLVGDPDESALYDTAVPLSSPERGVEANRVVTDLSSDSGKGPWWRRPLRFDEDGTAALLAMHEGEREIADG